MNINKILENRLLMLSIIFVIVSIMTVIAGDIIIQGNSMDVESLNVSSIVSGTGTVDFNDNDIKTTGDICDADNCYSVDQLSQSSTSNVLNYTKTIDGNNVILRFDIQ